MDVNNIINNILEHIKNLPSLPVQEAKEWLKESCNMGKVLINTSENYLKEKKLEETSKADVLLYLMQQYSFLSFSSNIFEEELKLGVILMDARNYCCTCFKHSLEMLEDCFHKSNVCKDYSGSFIKWMDLCLDKLSHIDFEMENVENSYKECYKVIEEVLCHAMSIGHIASGEDSKIIKGNAKAVLNSLNDLQDEIRKSPRNIPICNLLIDSTSDELCALERKVNTAVLRLCLKIFSNLMDPLDKVQLACLNSKNQGEEFDNFVADFDLHVDRIIQVGLFAIACTTYTQHIIKLKSNLASIESLEGFLVPSFLILGKQLSLENIACANFFKNHWLANAKSLKHLIYDIIEPSAFCKVAYDDLKKSILSLNEKVNSKRLLLNREDVAVIISQGKVVKEMIKATLGQVCVRNKSDFLVKYEHFKAVLREIEGASEELLGTGANNCIENSNRVLKRCKILLKLIKQIFYCYLEGDQQGNEHLEEKVKDEIISNDEKESKNIDFEKDFLGPLMNKSVKILNERSVMYRTPVKNEKTMIKNKFATTGCKTHFTRRRRLLIGNKNLPNEDSFINDTFTHLKSKSTDLIKA